MGRCKRLSLQGLRMNRVSACRQRFHFSSAGQMAPLPKAQTALRRSSGGSDVNHPSPNNRLKIPCRPFHHQQTVDRHRVLRAALGWSASRRQNVRNVPPCHPHGKPRGTNNTPRRLTIFWRPWLDCHNRSQISQGRSSLHCPIALRA